MLPETIIFLVRHGETEWNRQNRLQGNRDSPLTPKGVKQAYRLKHSLAQFPIDYAFSSPLKRAKNTLEIILEDRKLEVFIKDDLREINLGPWEGKTRKETALSHPYQYMNFLERPNLFNLPGADTFQELQNRMVDILDSIYSGLQGRKVLVVSHWIAIKVALAHYSSTPLSQLSDIPDPANGGFLRLSKGSGNTLVQQKLD